jgi:hypothetical protein
MKMTTAFLLGSRWKLRVYPRGVEVFLRIESVKYEKFADGWRWANYNEPEAVNAAVVGRIPFELVQEVEWSGDGYYRMPHIYCEFSQKLKQPYEEVVLYRIEKGVTRDIFFEIAKWDDVQKLSEYYPRQSKQ